MTTIRYYPDMGYAVIRMDGSTLIGHLRQRIIYHKSKLTRKRAAERDELVQVPWEG